MFISRSVSYGLAFSALLALAGAVSAQTPTTRIAVIDVQRVVNESQAGRAAVAALEAYGQEQQAALQQMADEIQRLRDRLATEGETLSAEEVEALRRDLETRSIDLNRASEDVQREFNRRQERAREDIERQVMPVVQQVGADGGYSLILRKFDAGLIYAASDVEITDEVIRRMDEQGVTGP